MVSCNNYKIVKIDITSRNGVIKYFSSNMNEDRKMQNRFMCSICLNRKVSQEEYIDVECCKRKSKSCPRCQKQDEDDELRNTNRKNREGNGKHIQTSQPDVTQGLTLLNEVLTVFQNKKQVEIKNKSKTVIFKDACVGTEDVQNKNYLSVSKILQYSIESRQANENVLYSVVCCHPETAKSQYPLDLTKRKSSSIPQMKLEELKQSMKEKTKSKDAIEEINRMFAVVRKNDDKSCDSNRPLIRNGPRVLPVVKTHHYQTDKPLAKCQCCQTNYQMSSGDNVKQHECCHNSGNNCAHLCCHCLKNEQSNTCIVCEQCGHKEYRIQHTAHE
ncbi:uncharacterized protein LOC116776157 [Danaus plexippus]|nr:uncharacterized protein LOC116776157 [Danaus plexippus]